MDKYKIVMYLIQDKYTLNKLKNLLKKKIYYSWGRHLAKRIKIVQIYLIS
jgi:hypothetical protein